MSGWFRVAGVEDCAPGTLTAVQAGGEAIVVANVGGDLYALEDQCSHEDLPLSHGELVDHCLECIYHGARFDLASGRAVALPAVRPVRTFEVDLREDGIYVNVDAQGTG